MTIQIATPTKESRPWTRIEIVSTFLTFMILYALSPPWTIAFARVTHAGPTVQNMIVFGYHPLTIARDHLPAVDRFYEGYGVLLTPWLSGLDVI